MPTKISEVFVTGGTGLAGSCALAELSSRGIPLRALARTPPAEAALPGVRYVQGDLSPPAGLQNLAVENAGIVHYACASLRGQADVGIDVDAMKALLRTWKHGPLVYISSIDVYGSPAMQSVSEDHPLSGRMGEYARGKVECESLIFEEARKRGRKDFTIFRAPWILGPNLRTRELLTSRFLQCFEGGPVLLPGETESEWSEFVDAVIDARDLAWLVAEAMQRPLGGAGNVIGSTFAWHEFFEALLRAAALDWRIEHRARTDVPEYAAELFGQTCTFSGARVERHFGFQPRFGLEETLAGAFAGNRIEE